MQISIVALAVIALAQAAYAAPAQIFTTSTCAFGASEPIDKTTLSRCLDSYKGADWGNLMCGGKSWAKEGSFWGSPVDCHTICKPCLGSAIADGRGGATCHASSGLAACEMSYGDQILPIAPEQPNGTAAE